MRYKFTFEKNAKQDIVNVFEAGQIDNNFVVMYEGASSLKEIQKASKAGAEEFFSKLRRKNFFPNTPIMTKLYESTIEFFADKSQDKIVIDYEDAETLAKEVEEEVEEVNVNGLLADDDDTSEDAIKEIDTEDDTPKFKPEDNSESED